MRPNVLHRLAERPDLTAWRRGVLDAATAGRLAHLFGTAQGPDTVRLTAVTVAGDAVSAWDVDLPTGQTEYPALTPDLPAAAWYERVLHDLFGLRPTDHPRLDPLLLPLADDAVVRPRPGHSPAPPSIEPDEQLLPRRVLGPGVFTIPHGPVRSGVFESVEYLVETPGEDIPYVQIRVFAKHRGIEKRFEGLSLPDATALSERVEGIASVAHALAFSHAVESLAEVRVPRPARLVRVLHAELERIANHLDVAVRLADAAGLAVATARFGWHKERVLRLVGDCCGSRFGRGVVVPGGVSALPALRPADLLSRVDRLQADLVGDVRALMASASFLDRIRGTGPLRPERAREHGALGPIGRASGFVDDAREERPYDAYPMLGLLPGRRHTDGDAMARLRVRWAEVSEAFHLIRQVLDELSGSDTGQPLVAPITTGDGRGIGWAEAPQGEVLYAVELADERIVRCAPRSASFHNLVLFHEVFTGDIFTDFPFIEASFGLSVAGVVL